MYRHISKGAWTFSMQDHGWQVSDCTSEGLKVVYLLYYFNRTQKYDLTLNKVGLKSSDNHVDS